jgi:hypothetical protein
MISLKQIGLVICFAYATASCSSLQSSDSTAVPQPTSASIIQDDNAAAVTEAAHTSLAGAQNACPSREFSRFLRAFSNSAEVQQKFTKLPLEYGQFDATALGTEQDYERRTIKSFEKIPSFDSHNGGIVIPSESQRKGERELLVVEARGRREDPEYPLERKSRDDMVARLFVDDTGFHIYYRFQWVDGCWFLRAIHDKS